MIAGIGTDIVAIARMARLLARHGDAGVAKILSTEELAGFHDNFGKFEADKEDASLPAEAQRKQHRAAAYLAKRFAAKEALSKAFGTGLREPLTLTAITVRNDDYGKPSFVYTTALAAWIEAKNLTAHLSISDERDYAVAFVILEKA